MGGVSSELEVQWPTLPNATSSNLHLTHPTDSENEAIWKLISNSWKDALTVSQYVEECAHLLTVPLAKNEGMTLWILTDKTLPPDQRPILASCETFLKRSIISDGAGNATEAISHGVASVYCDPRYQGRGYASRMMRELGTILANWQTAEKRKCVASILFSDIGREFYSKRGWHAFPSYHIEIDSDVNAQHNASPIFTDQIAQLCEDDETMVRKSMAQPSKYRMRFTVLPDRDHMFWHIAKEEFACKKLFEKDVLVKGALAGEPGKRVWAIWSHRFYGPPEDPSSENTLFILRLVIEDEQGYSEQVDELKAVLQAARAEAARWNLRNVKLWDPSPELQEMIHRTGISPRKEEREKDEICSLRWYGDGDGKECSLKWVAAEKYCWC